MSDPHPGPGPSGAQPDDSRVDPPVDPQRDDCFGPPEVPVEVFCLHCGHVYMSDLMLAIDVDGTIHYACPVKGCDALGYKFDIFPVNDDDEEDGGWIEDEDEEFDEEELPDEFTQVVDDNGEIPFDPPSDWSPDADAEEADGEDFAEEETRYFTRDDYDALKATGEYDRRAEEVRRWWRECKDSGSSNGVKEDDIPF